MGSQALSFPSSLPPLAIVKLIGDPGSYQDIPFSGTYHGSLVGAEFSSRRDDDYPVVLGLGSQHSTLGYHTNDQGGAAVASRHPFVWCRRPSMQHCRVVVAMTGVLERGPMECR